MTLTWQSWAGSASCSPERVVAPRTVAEVAATVTSARELRVVGGGHSFSPVVCTDGVLMTVDALRTVGEPEPLPRTEGRATHTVTVGAGLRLRELNRALAARGLAMSNLGDIDSQSVAGAISTGTHGTGGAAAGLATMVRGVGLVLADGSHVEVSPESDPALFEVARLGLGAAGVLTSVTLAVEPAFTLRAVEEPWPLARVLAELDGPDGLLATNEHVEMFWFPHTDRALTKRNNRVPADDAPLHPVRGWVDDELLSNQVFELANRVGARAPRTVPTLARISARALGPRVYTAPSHEVFVSARRVRFHETEWALPRAAMPAVLAELEQWIDRTRTPVSFPVEVRFAAAEDVWLSTAHGRDTAYVAVHQFHRGDHRALFAAAQDIMVAHDGRPHWGKMHDLDAGRLAHLYPRFDDALRVVARADPAGRFRNAHLRQVLE